jgi:hypothetical protein
MNFNFLKTLQSDLRERQIFPAVIVLAVLAVAIPIVAPMVLGNSSTPPPVAIAPQPVSLPAGVKPPERELVLLTTAPPVISNVRHGNEPNPFRVSQPTATDTGSAPSTTPAATTPAKTSTTPASTTPAKTTPATTTPAKTTPTPGKTSPSKGAGSKPKPKAIKPKGSTTTGSGSTGSGSKTTPPATATPTTGPATLKATQAYTVNIDTKDATGTHALSDVVRLAPLPAAQTPEVIFLGVLSGGQKAAFLFTNAVKVSGAGGSGLTCLPSAADCQIVEMAPGQGISLTPTSNTALISTFTFELMSIGAQDFSSASAATSARDAVSAAGQTLLPLYSSTALQTLRFDDKVGALVHHSVPAGGSTASTGSTGSTAATGSTGATGAGPTNTVRFPAGVAFAAAPAR